MRIAYAAYAAIIIGFLWLSHGDSLVGNVALWVTLALWCMGLVAVFFNVWWSRWVALAAFAPVMGVLLFQFGSRVAFIAEHGGLDCDTCNASPMAFLLGWSAQVVLLIPGIFLCVWLLRNQAQPGIEGR
jgi:hypothetical protein